MGEYVLRSLSARLFLPHVRQHFTVMAPLTDLFSVRQLAATLGRNEETIRRWLRRGKLRSLKLTPRTIRVRAEDLERFLESSERSSDSE
jgi:excisionase family DNA binding protein